MAPPNPKRPPRPPRPPGTQAPKDSDVELPFDDDEVDPLRADDPRPQRVPQFPAGSRRSKRQGGERGTHDRELSPRFDLAHEYSDPGFAPAFLYVERGPGVGQLVPVKQGPLVMGRSSSSDLRLQHPSISRRHAQLVRRGERFVLKDLSSQNGTFLNRNRVTAEVEVMPGDEISLGNALVRLRGPGSMPAVGAPVASAPVKTGRRRKGVGTLGVALIAAAVGSAVAALLTLIAVSVGGDEEAPTPPSQEGPTTPLMRLSPGETGSADGERQAPTGEAPSDGAPGAPASADSAGAADGMATAPGGESRAAGTTSTEGREGTTADEARAGNPPRMAAGPSAREVARGALGSPTRRQERPEARGQVTSPESSSGMTRQERSGVATSPARNDAQEASPSAGDVAAGGTRQERPETGDVTAGSTRPRSGKEGATEADVLRRYEAGDVPGAREQARAAKLNTLHAQLARFESAEAESRKAQSKGDLPRAISQLTVAVSVDQTLAHGWSKHGAQLRKRLSDLHVQQGTAHSQAGEVAAARGAFEQALKYDAGNHKAREQLGRLSSAAAP